MPRSKHILPFLLEGDVQEINSATTNQAWNQLTSFVNIANTAAIDFTVGEPLQKVPGALLSVIKENADASDITVKLSTLAIDDEFDDIVLEEQDNCVLLMWNGLKWVVLGQFLSVTSTFTGGTVTGATTFSGNVGFYGESAQAQPSSAGETTGFTAGAGTSVLDDSTFTGNVGTIAYTISDVVKHLKALGLLDS